jgi:bifunctional DNase/RNase
VLGRGLLSLLIASSLGCGHQARVTTGAPPPAPVRPGGYAEVTVLGVAPLEEGNAVLVADEAGGLILPIAIGETEGLVIHQRLRGEPFPRPMTHDLLDAALRRAGCAVVQVQVDDLVDQTFIGSIVVSQGGRLFTLDARPSDAIALAVGNRVPIYVARKVLERAGLRKDALPPAPPQPA